MKMVLLYYLLITLTVKFGQTQSGMRVMVSQKTLKEINAAELKDMEQDLRKKSFDDINGQDGDLEYKISSIHVTELGSLNADIGLGNNAITWNGYLSYISARADWWVKYEVDALISFDVSDDGSVGLEVGQTSMIISIVPSVSEGVLSITVGHCQAKVGHLEPHFHGGLLAKILDVIKRVFISKMKSKLEDWLCRAVRRSLENLSENMKAVDALYEANLPNLKVVIDNSFSDLELTEASITTYHKGSLRWNDRHLATTLTSIHFPPPGDLGLCFDISTDVLNNLFGIAAESGMMDGNITYVTENTENQQFLLLSCGDWDLCLGNIFRKVSDAYPDRYAGLYWRVKEAGIQTQRNELSSVIRGKLNINADKDDSSMPLFSCTFDLTIPLQLKYTDSYIAARTNGIGGSITIDESSVGQILTVETKLLLNGFIQAMKSTVIKRINGYSIRYDIKLPRELTVKKSKLTIFPGSIRVEADVCYKSDCAFEGLDEWVGSSTLSDDISIDLNDITSEGKSAADEKSSGHNEL